MPIYMQYDGIKGSVTEEKHKDWIELQSCQMGVHRQMKTPTGQAANRGASVPSFSEVVVTKDQDSVASTPLFRASTSGEGKKCVIDFVRSEGNKVEVYMTITLTDALISSYNVSGHGGDAHSAPMESLSLNFAKIEFATVSRDAKDKSGGTARANFDLASGKAG